MTPSRRRTTRKQATLHKALIDDRASVGNKRAGVSKKFAMFRGLAAIRRSFRIPQLLRLNESGKDS